MEHFFVGLLAILQGLGIFLVIPIIIAIIIISLVLILGKIRREMIGPIKESIETLVCSIDADCPEGYLCIGGKCIAQT